MPREALGPEQLQSFGLGDIPSGAYKAHFSSAYDAAVTKNAANVAERRSNSEDERAANEATRLGIARHLMRKLGYSDKDLEFLDQDVLRMQGVGSPFPCAALQAGEDVLDLGSGFGCDAFLAAHKVGLSGRVIGVDLSALEVEKATRRALERGLGERCNFVEADMEALPFAAASMDVVLSNGGFCLCPNKRTAFHEVHRVLRPGGRMAVSCTVLRRPLPPLEGKRWPPCMEVFMPAWEIEALLRSLGFADVRVDASNSRMDVWDLQEDDRAEVAKAMGLGANPSSGCSHARRAQERRAQQAVDKFLSSEREAGIHWGNPEFEHVDDFDMNELCARVVIVARKT